MTATRWAALTPAQRRAAAELKRRAEQRARARRDTADPIRWAREWLPDVIPLEAGPHHRWLATRLDPAGPTGVRAFGGAPRGSGKSTVATVLVPILAAARRSHRFAVIVRATETDAAKAVEAIKAALETRPEIQRQYPWLRIVRYSDGELRLAGMIIVPRGAGSAIRGLNRQLGNAIVRPDLVLIDDLETEETARSKLLTDRLAEWILAAVGQLGGPPGEAGSTPLDIIGIGTTLAPSAVATRILDRRETFAAWDAGRFPAEARIKPRAELDADELERADTAMTTAGLTPHPTLAATDSAGTPVPIPIPAQLENTGAPAEELGHPIRIPLWPEGMPLAYLDELLDPRSPIFMGTRLYAQEHLLRPQARGDALFKPEHTIWIREVPRLERPAIGVDAAASKRTAADYTAVVATGILTLPSLEDGKPGPPAIAVPYAGRRRQTLHELIGWVHAVWLELNAEHGPPTVVFEANGAFVWGAQELRRVHRLPVRAVHADTDKLTRAQPAGLWHEAGRVLVADHLRGGEFPDELHAFTGTNADAHDDQVDAFVWAASYSTSAWRRR